MNDVTRALLVLLFIIVLFGLSFWAYDHIDNSYMMNEPEHVVELEAAVDSLTTALDDQKKRHTKLKEECDGIEEAEESEEVADE
jgi:hypothetical protein